MGRSWRGGFLILLLICQSAAARPLCRLEQPRLRGDQLEVLATRVSLDGQLLQGTRWGLGREDQALRLVTVERWRAEEQPLYFVLLVEGSSAYAEATQAMRRALKLFLGALPRDSAGQLWTFGTRRRGVEAFHPAAALLDEATRYNAVMDGEIQLLRTVTRAALELQEKAVPLAARRAIVVVADGRNPVMSPQWIRERGEEIGAKEIPVFTIGYTPQDLRWPLRNLGDLSKRTGGTFRWARSADDLTGQLLALAKELQGAEVLRFEGARRAFGSAGPLALQLRCNEGTSNVCALQRAATKSRRKAAVVGLGTGLIILILGTALWVGRRPQRSRGARA